MKQHLKRCKALKGFPFLILLLVLGMDSCKPKQTTQEESQASRVMKLDTAARSRQSALDETGRHWGDVASSFLRSRYKKDLDKGLIDSSSRQFFVAAYDLNGDGKKELFVKLAGTYFCGSGGCTVLLIDDAQQLLGGFTVVNGPIAIMRSETKGWADLLMGSNDKVHRMRFSGIKYPTNPSLEPVVNDTTGLVKATFLNVKADEKSYMF